MPDLSAVSRQLRTAVRQNGVFQPTALLECVFVRLFEGLVYTQTWEDPVVDIAALQIQPDDHLICIASGGCNVLSYLVANPALITAVDLSPAHIALGRLKLVAATTLTQTEFFDFFGHADRKSNVTLYNSRIAPALDDQSRRFWEGRRLGRQRIGMFARGFYHYGLLGLFFGTIHATSRMARLDFEPLLQAQSLDEQQRFYDRHLAPVFAARSVRWLLRRRAYLLGLGMPPAQYDKLAAGGGGDVVPVLQERVRKLACDFPISTNYFAWQAFARRYPLNAVPPYLEARNFHAVAANAHRVTLHNRSLTDLLAERGDTTVDAFSLLDAQDWMTDAQLNALWVQINRCARPGARVIFRTVSAGDLLPGRLLPSLLDRWTYDAEQSAAGFAQDRSAVYGGFHLYRYG